MSLFPSTLRVLNMRWTKKISKNAILKISKKKIDWMHRGQNFGCLREVCDPRYAIAGPVVQWFHAVRVLDVWCGKLELLITGVACKFALMANGFRATVRPGCKRTGPLIPLWLNSEEWAYVREERIKSINFTPSKRSMLHSFWKFTCLYFSLLPIHFLQVFFESGFKINCCLVNNPLPTSTLAVR